MSGGGVAGFGASLDVSDATHFSSVVDAAPDGNQRADDGSHHVVKEAVTHDLDPDEVTCVLGTGWRFCCRESIRQKPLTLHGQLHDGSHAGGFVGPLGFEAAEVIRANQLLSGFVHGS